MRDRSIRQLLPIVGFAFFAVAAGVFGFMELVAGRNAWAALMVVGSAVSVAGMRLQIATSLAATEQTQPRPRGATALERAVQLVWAFAGGAATAVAVMHYRTGHPEAGVLYAAAAVACALGLAAALTAQQVLCRHQSVTKTGSSPV